MGDHISQPNLEKIRIVDVLEADELSDTERTASGFGLTRK